MQHQNSGILTLSDVSVNDGLDSLDITSNAMPTPWVRGLMLTRVNSILRGHSAVSMPTINAIVALIEHDLTPIIPLRGSISASGDLQPLSFVAATLQGNPSMFVRTGMKHGHHVVCAPEALQIAGLEPVVLAAKEGLGLLNGTAASASVASLALYETNNLALLSQALTAMGVEALRGTADSFHPFISMARPHRGQAHVASTILSFLQGSRLAQGLVQSELDQHLSGLCQDRYALRTAPQWIGPLLEDLELSYTQVTVELNSTTDNPLINPTGRGTIHHGGNFQASSVTSAMEKARNALQHLGKILFSQATEMMNPATSRGLPPNLAPDHPSLSYTCKGLDINMAAYASELGWLNHPLGPHVQSAEMHNQAVNSLALISGRATQQAVEVLSMMSAAYLFTACQALDLRVLLERFFDVVLPDLAKMSKEFYKGANMNEESTDASIASIVDSFPNIWNTTTNLDLTDRSNSTAEAVSGHLINAVISSITDATTSAVLDQETFSLSKLVSFRRQLSTLLFSSYTSVRTELFDDYLILTPPYLGRGSRALYTFVRGELGIPFFRGLVEDPVDTSSDGNVGREKKSIGAWVSLIYEALRDGRVMTPLIDAL